MPPLGASSACRSRALCATNRAPATATQPAGRAARVRPRGSNAAPPSTTASGPGRRHPLASSGRHATTAAIEQRTARPADRNHRQRGHRPLAGHGRRQRRTRVTGMAERRTGTRAGAPEPGPETRRPAPTAVLPAAQTLSGLARNIPTLAFTGTPSQATSPRAIQVRVGVAGLTVCCLGSLSRSVGSDVGSSGYFSPTTGPFALFLIRRLCRRRTNFASYHSQAPPRGSHRQTHHVRCSPLTR